MIGKITKGSSFRGCVSYVLGKQDARLLEAEGVLADGIPAVVAGFQAQRMMNPDIRQPVGHISLSYAPEDARRLTDSMMVLLAKEYMEKMGIKDTQYIIARHHDQKHPHIHIVYNRIDNNGRTISDRNDRVRNVSMDCISGKARTECVRTGSREKTRSGMRYIMLSRMCCPGFAPGASLLTSWPDMGFRPCSNIRARAMSYKDCPSPRTDLLSRLRR